MFEPFLTMPFAGMDNFCVKIQKVFDIPNPGYIDLTTYGHLNKEWMLRKHVELSQLGHHFYEMFFAQFQKLYDKAFRKN